MNLRVLKADTLDRVGELQRLAREHGRPAIPATAFGVPRTADLEELAALGFHRAVFLLPTAGADRVVPAIEELAAAPAAAPAEPEVGEREEHLSGPVREGNGWGTKLMKSLERVDTWLTDLNNGDLHRRQKAS